MLFAFATETVKRHLNARKDKIAIQNLQDSALINPFNLVIEYPKSRILRPNQWHRRKTALEPSQITLKEILTTSKDFEKQFIKESKYVETDEFYEVLQMHSGAPKWKQITREYRIKLLPKELLFVDLKLGQLNSIKVDVSNFSQFLLKCQVNMEHSFVKELKKQRCPLYVVTDVVYLNDNAIIELRRKSNESNNETVVKIGLKANTRLIFGMRRLKIDSNGQLKLNHISSHGFHANSFIKKNYRRQSTLSSGEINMAIDDTGKDTLLTICKEDQKAAADLINLTSSHEYLHDQSKTRDSSEKNDQVKVDQPLDSLLFYGKRRLRVGSRDSFKLSHISSPDLHLNSYYKERNAQSSVLSSDIGVQADQLPENSTNRSNLCRRSTNPFYPVQPSGVQINVEQADFGSSFHQEDLLTKHDHSERNNSISANPLFTVDQTKFLSNPEDDNQAIDHRESRNGDKKQGTSQIDIEDDVEREAVLKGHGLSRLMAPYKPKVIYRKKNWRPIIKHYHLSSINDLDLLRGNKGKTLHQTKATIRADSGQHPDQDASDTSTSNSTRSSHNLNKRLKYINQRLATNNSFDMNSGAGNVSDNVLATEVGLQMHQPTTGVDSINDDQVADKHFSLNNRETIPALPLPNRKSDVVPEITPPLRPDLHFNDLEQQTNSQLNLEAEPRFQTTVNNSKVIENPTGGRNDHVSPADIMIFKVASTTNGPAANNEAHRMNMNPYIELKISHFANQINMSSTRYTTDGNPSSLNENRTMETQNIVANIQTNEIDKFDPRSNSLIKQIQERHIIQLPGMVVQTFVQRTSMENNDLALINQTNQTSEVQEDNKEPAQETTEHEINYQDELNEIESLIVNSEARPNFVQKSVDLPSNGFVESKEVDYNEIANQIIQDLDNEVQLSDNEDSSKEDIESKSVERLFLSNDVGDLITFMNDVQQTNLEEINEINRENPQDHQVSDKCSFGVDLEVGDLTEIESSSAAEDILDNDENNSFVDLKEEEPSIEVELLNCDHKDDLTVEENENNSIVNQEHELNEKVETNIVPKETEDLQMDEPIKEIIGDSTKASQQATEEIKVQNPPKSELENNLPENNDSNKNQVKSFFVSKWFKKLGKKSNEGGVQNANQSDTVAAVGTSDSIKSADLPMDSQEVTINDNVPLNPASTESVLLIDPVTTVEQETVILASEETAKLYDLVF